MSRTRPIAIASLTVLLSVLMGALTLAQGAAAPPYPSESDLIEVMFAPESSVRLRADGLVDLATNALSGVDQVLAGVDGAEWARICDVPEEKLDQLQASGMEKTGGEIYNLNNIYRLRFDDKAGAVDVWKLAADLEALPGIMLARPVPLPMAAPLPPDYDPSQNYNDPASSVPTGIDARYAWTQTGGDGTGVTICDLEYSWNYNHNDITKAFGSQINTNVADPFSDNNHGTAVLGEMVSDDNAPNWGTKGGCYGANIKTCGTYYGLSPSWNVPGALAVAIANLNAGDVILIEQQWDYTGSGGNYVPIEWWMNYSPNAQSYNGVYAAIVTAISNGIHVVEAGGNGNVDTDLMTWYGDSGAIIVGAGGAYPGGSWPETNLERLSFSSYGSRFNLQGWGENVVTTGYGSLYNAEGVNRYYTSTFAGTSSASPIVTAAVACCQGYWLANISTTPYSPAAMRTLLVNTGTPQYFGNPGNIGPRPDCYAAIQSMSQMASYEYGDAPEGAVAYPSTGVIGAFPTCTAGPSGFVRHTQSPLRWLGPSVDYEPDGNAGNCPNFPPYDADECWNDGDAGLQYPPAYTINGMLQVVPCSPPNTGFLGPSCTWAVWGANLDLQVVNNGPTCFVNVLMDWDQNGVWAGSSQCPGNPAPEHVLVNQAVPGGYVGLLSALGPPQFMIGPNGGYVWTRFTISEVAVPQGWGGGGTFQTGESSDYLLNVYEYEHALDYGDAPEGALAYPPLGIFGSFPTCVGSGAAGFVSHASTGQLYFGPMVDLEWEGNAGNCPNFPPYDADECFADGDAGLITPNSYTIDAASNIVPCPNSMNPGSIGVVCNWANWGPNVDMQVTNNTLSDAYVNVLMDWNQDGQWQGSSQCPAAPTAEWVLVNLLVPSGYMGPLAGLGAPAFQIGPNSGYVWCRFTVSDSQVLAADWDGSGAFDDGETCDYLLRVDPDEERLDFGDAPEGSIAYPATGVTGMFPTCLTVWPAGFVSHQITGTLFIGPGVDVETDGNAGNCPLFPPYDADECWNDGDAGLLFPGPYTLDGALNIVPCAGGPGSSLGLTCNTAVWGVNLDLLVTNNTQWDAVVNVLMDWNQDGQWQGSSQCPQGVSAPEHVLVDFVVPAGYSGTLSALGPPPFVIGPKWDYVWSRFTISEASVGSGWEGAMAFAYGETSDYLLEVQRDMTGVEETEGPITATRLLPALPNPFYGATTIRFELIRPGDVSVGVYDVAGRMIRALIGGPRTAGREEIVWDGRNDAGEKVASGMYFVRLRSEGRSYSSPLILLR